MERAHAIMPKWTIITCVVVSRHATCQQCGAWWEPTLALVHGEFLAFRSEIWSRCTVLCLKEDMRALSHQRPSLPLSRSSSSGGCNPAATPFHQQASGPFFHRPFPVNLSFMMAFHFSAPISSSVYLSPRLNALATIMAMGASHTPGIRTGKSSVNVPFVVADSKNDVPMAKLLRDAPGPDLSTRTSQYGPRQYFDQCRYVPSPPEVHCRGVHGSASCNRSCIHDSCRCIARGACSMVAVAYSSCLL